MPRIADVRDYMQKVQALKYVKEACYNGTLIIKAWVLFTITALLSKTKFSDPTGRHDSLYRLVGAMAMDYQTVVKMGNVAGLNLMRQSSCPAGLFSHFSVQNGAGPVLGLLLLEIFPNRIRAKAMAFWIFNSSGITDRVDSLELC
ncbi:hypothetical protein F0562_020084 [Nyssa sinensis]|uniref:Uncharacterized protein n=1 Tax=Nyssa sinensis TaxID=561372 RepID=A0A5J5BT81_9ASTE|nr:hypothetical protein F0562_020084 [Nyssa sinensis]